MRTSSVFFGNNIIYHCIYQAIGNNIVAKKTIELILLFHNKITMTVFLAQYEPKKLQSVKCFHIVHCTSYKYNF